jgi:hypothetical protein
MGQNIPNKGLSPVVWLDPIALIPCFLPLFLLYRMGQGENANRILFWMNGLGGFGA